MPGNQPRIPKKTLPSIHTNYRVCLSNPLPTAGHRVVAEPGVAKRNSASIEDITTLRLWCCWLQFKVPLLCGYHSLCWFFNSWSPKLKKKKKKTQNKTMSCRIKADTETRCDRHGGVSLRALRRGHCEGGQNPGQRLDPARRRLHFLGFK